VSKKSSAVVSPVVLENLLSVEQACQVLGISESTLQRLVRARAFSFNRIGKQLRFKPSVLSAYIEKTERKAHPPVCLKKEAAA
jgi:excisionase family DNA binding protein